MTAQLLTIVIIVIDVSGGLSERTMGQPFLFVWGFIIIIIIMHPLTNRVSIMRMTNRRQPKCMKFRKYVQNYSQRCLSEKQNYCSASGCTDPSLQFCGGDFAPILQNGLCPWAFWFLPSLLILPVFCKFLDPPLLVIHELSAFAVALCCQKN